MKTHTVFTLLDGSQHDSLKKAKEHCLEMMGAETRDMLYDIMSQKMIYSAALKLVSDKKYDNAIKTYLAWRKEHDALETYEAGDDFHD